jgi:two-component system, LuxR family, response regulator FixJ
MLTPRKTRYTSRSQVAGNYAEAGQPNAHHSARYCSGSVQRVLQAFPKCVHRSNGERRDRTESSGHSAKERSSETTREKKSEILTVAVVDDDQSVCDSVSFLLETLGFRVRTYLSAAAFLADNPKISCLIVDYLMPNVNGLELISELRNRGEQVPVIMITATTDRSVERRAAQLGIKRVLRKPLGENLGDIIRDELK